MKYLKYVGNIKFANNYESNMFFIIKEKPMYSIKIWNRYLIDIFSNKPPIKEIDFGLTKEFENNSGPFEKEDCFVEIDTLDYSADLKQYLIYDDFSFDETKDVLYLIVDFLQFAIENNYTVLTKYVR